MFIRLFLLALGISSLLQGCAPADSGNVITLDPAMHTFSNYRSVRTKHLEWDVDVDFKHKRISGIATWTFQNTDSSKYIHFDTYDLSIRNAKVNGKAVQYYQTPFVKDYGSGLSIPIKPGDTVVSIEYHTGPQASALQWLSAAQTAGKKLPYLFTQCESIHARSLLPCQDVPANRITYHAVVGVPKDMMAVMSARNPTEKTADGIYNFTMEIPVPTYLIALAVGDIAYAPIDDRSGVYTEPVMLQKAAAELSDIPAMMKAAEALGGPYRWGKYDVLIAPPSFPIGGMENPRLTFATPTILAGDKSLVSLIAHEMAHSWSGNLVTNATWDDLWLNEGFTTYFERRIMEKISDPTYTDMMWELGYQDMLSDIDNLGKDHPDTRLHVELTKRHPGDAFSNIPYEKGAAFLRVIERTVGRERFDPWLNAYFSRFAFTPTTTADCLRYMDTTLFRTDSSLKQKIGVDTWVYQPGIPSNSIRETPLSFVKVEQALNNFKAGAAVTSLQTFSWSTHEWLHFLRNLPHPLALARMKELDERFQLSVSTNSEIADEWYRLSIASGYQDAYAAMEEFLCTVGRKKFLEPLYLEMKKTPEGLKMAQRIFEKAKPNYHPQTAEKIEGLLRGE
jgi:leukotriene-A4 hydrolase